MSEKPIIFSGEMVRAILDGRKTQTRRVAKFTCGGHLKEPNGHRRWHPDDPNAILACPYGQPGDRLWVKENIRCTSIWHEVPAGQPMSGRDVAHAVYDADEQQAPLDAWPWERYMLSSLFCPRGLSRITLEITGIRVERLREITPTDAMAEGVADSPGGMWSATEGQAATSPQAAFALLWNSINAKRGYGWDANPYVWVIEFRRIDPQ